jgi:hypothetical protein
MEHPRKELQGEPKTMKKGAAKRRARLEKYNTSLHQKKWRENTS